MSYIFLVPYFPFRQAGDDLTEALEHYYSFIDDSVEYASDCIHENLVFFLHNANETLKNNVAEAIADLRTKSRFVLSFQPQVRGKKEENVGEKRNNNLF